MYAFFLFNAIYREKIISIFKIQIFNKDVFFAWTGISSSTDPVHDNSYRSAQYKNPTRQSLRPKKAV